MAITKLDPARLLGPGSVVQVQFDGGVSTTSSNALLPHDNSKPQISEGLEVFSISITPSNASNILVVSGVINVAFDNGSMQGAIFQDSGANAVAAFGSMQDSPAAGLHPLPFLFKVAAGSVSSTTFSIRLGSNGNIWKVNLDWNGAGLFDGVTQSYMKVEEIAA